jgi:hypothetical protein
MQDPVCEPSGRPTLQQRGGADGENGEAGGVLATADIFEFEEFRLDRREGLARRDERGAFVRVAIGPRP